MMSATQDSKWSVRLFSQAFCWSRLFFLVFTRATQAALLPHCTVIHSRLSISLHLPLWRSEILTEAPRQHHSVTKPSRKIIVLCKQHASKSPVNQRTDFFTWNVLCFILTVKNSYRETQLGRDHDLCKTSICWIMCSIDLLSIYGSCPVKLTGGTAANLSCYWETDKGRSWSSRISPWGLINYQLLLWLRWWSRISPHWNLSTGFWNILLNNNN